jgi:glycosyltransferase involved in cell wall biosynthesis
MAEIVEKNKCGVVFEPNISSLYNAIIRLQNNYEIYQKNCRKTAEFFSEKIFVKKYEAIYSEIK